MATHGARRSRRRAPTRSRPRINHRAHCRFEGRLALCGSPAKGHACGCGRAVGTRLGRRRCGAPLHRRCGSTGLPSRPSPRLLLASVAICDRPRRVRGGEHHRGCLRHRRRKRPPIPVVQRRPGRGRRGGMVGASPEADRLGLRHGDHHRWHAWASPSEGARRLECRLCGLRSLLAEAVVAFCPSDAAGVVHAVNAAHSRQHRTQMRGICHLE